MGSWTKCHSNVSYLITFHKSTILISVEQLYHDFYFDRYVFWDQHEPIEGVYNFEGNNDLVAFIELAQKIGFVVILRVGPLVISTN